MFIVGWNPATSIDFWRFWSDDYGFHKDRFDTAYEASRPRPSNTRWMINRVVAEAEPVRCLETNICAKPTRRGGDLDRRERNNTAPFDYLLRKVKPRLVIAHGKEAQAHLVACYGVEFELWKEKHFRFWSKLRAREIGRRIRDKYIA